MKTEVKKGKCQSRQMSESMPLAIFLTLAGGFQDAYSYNCRGKVFANAQTGNIVLLGQNLAQGQWKTALHYLVPLCAFFLGVYIQSGCTIVSEKTKRYTGDRLSC